MSALGRFRRALDSHDLGRQRHLARRRNMSNDNFFFVRAVDTEGNGSPAVFPRP
jgi:hypothetical protein